jgi:glycosyltransferase involved in cell wall biosynthesis
VGDDELPWLYANSAGVVAASYEDFGLTPLEGAALGIPSAVLRWGGFLETVADGVTGVFFDEPTADQIARAVRALQQRSWDSATLIAHARRYSEPRFIDRLRRVVYDEVGRQAATRRGEREPTAPLVTA